jgi:hypothetical protein
MAANPKTLDFSKLSDFFVWTIGRIAAIPILGGLHHQCVPRLGFDQAKRARVSRRPSGQRCQLDYQQLSSRSAMTSTIEPRGCDTFPVARIGEASIHIALPLESIALRHRIALLERSLIGQVYAATPSAAQVVSSDSSGQHPRD